ncbi:glycosyl hydrolase [Aquirufa sp. ROCK-SH2]
MKQISLLLILGFIVFGASAQQKTWSPFYAKLNPVTPLNTSSFAHPKAEDLPWVRWNFPPETAEISELEKQLVELKAAGIAGVEIGQGGEPTLTQIEALLKKGNELGIKISLKYKTGAPIPGNFSIKNDFARKTLSASDTLLNAGQIFTDSLPGKGTLLAVHAYRVNKIPLKDSKLLTIDASSRINLWDQVKASNGKGYFGKPTTGHLTWTAPAGEGNWTIIVIRMVGVDPQPEVFSLEGTRLLIQGYESYWTTSIKELLKQNAGDIFIDSHSIDGFGAPSDVWSSNMALDFQTQVGYDLMPHLPILIDAGIDRVWGPRGGGMDIKHYYTYSDQSDVRIRADYNQVRSNLFVENRIKPFSDWAHGYNLALRLQPEDVPTVNIPDQIQVSYFLDRPEHETLSSGDQIDVYRPMASANHISGNTWYSNELAAARSLNYAQTFQDILVRQNKNFASGQSKGVYHVYPYSFNPKSVWPGYNTFAEGNFANSWGPRNPIWAADALMINTWMARNEQVLKQGRAKIDVAVYMQNYSFPAPFVAGVGNIRFWNDLSLQEQGYTWDYLNPSMLYLPQVNVSHQRLYEAGPSYKAFILNGHLQSGSVYNPAKNTLPIQVAEIMLNYAKSGLPVILVGPLPSRTPGNKPSEDEKLKQILEELKKHQSVHSLATEKEVPGFLKSIGINPSMEPEKPSSLMSMRRFDPKTGTNYYFLYNQGDDQIPPPGYSTEEKYKNLQGTPGNMFEEPKAVRTKGPTYGTKIGKELSTKISLEGYGQPFLMNAWSGEIQPIVYYQRKGNRVWIDVHLAVDESMLIGISQNPKQLGLPSQAVHTLSTTAEGVIPVSNGQMAIYASQKGKYLSILSNGKKVISQIPASMEAKDLTIGTWKLRIEDWKPANPYGRTGSASVTTEKSQMDLTLNGLKPWPDIAELKNVSGIGTYTYELELPSDWNPAKHGAKLSLGQVVDTFTLKVNGKSVSVDQISAETDLGATLKAGKNSIEIRVATTLNNRLVSLNKAAADRGIIQEYGLVGPVLLKPYSKALITLK